MALADAGYTRTEIAAKLDLLYHRVAGVLKRGGRQMPNQTAIVQSARSRALNKARGEATRVKVRDLDDQGRRRAEIAAELGLSLQCVAQVLSDAGRGINAAERIARSRATRKAQSAALRAEILALDDLGRSRQEIAAQLVRSKCKAVSDSLEEAGDRLFTFTRLPPSQWKSARTTNAIERAPRGVQAPDQNPDGAAVRRDCSDVVLGTARLRSDHYAQSGRMAEPDPETRRQPD